MHGSGSARGCNSSGRLDKPGLPPWGPHVRFRRVQTLFREGSPLVKLHNFALGTQRNVRRSGEERLRFTRSPICTPAPTCAAVARGVAGARHRPEGIVVA
jgi:hypothetical protein